MNAPVQTLPTLAHPPGSWAWKLPVLAQALTHRKGSEHATALSLSGELLSRGVPSLQVPAIVEHAGILAGWSEIADRRKAAESTIERANYGLSVRRDVDARILTALDGILDPAPDRTKTLTAAEAGVELRRLIADAPDGVSCVVSPCGVGKTRQTQEVAAAGGRKTVISVPTNALAKQITGDLRARGVQVARAFGVLSVVNADGSPACAYHGQAEALGSAGLSVRQHLCEGSDGGQTRDRCEHYEGCPARETLDGETDAKTVVGNHGLLIQLSSAAGKTGTLVIDEPPALYDELVVELTELPIVAAQMLRWLKPDYAKAMGSALMAVHSAAIDAPLHEPLNVAEACDLYREGLSDEVHDVWDGQDVPVRLTVAARHMVRSRTGNAEDLARCVSVCRLLRRALLEPVAVAKVTTLHRGEGRVITVSAPAEPVRRALTRDGRTVLLGADMHLWAEHIERQTGYEPPLTRLDVADGCAVRRVQVRTKGSYARWALKKNRPVRLIQQALSYTSGKTCVVTYLRLVPWLKKHLANIGRDDIQVAHYGGLRGLDGWKDADALITLGDPVPNLDAVARSTDGDVYDRGDDLARAELEQAHGRLRVIHRSKPATMIHVGRLCPLGWRRPIEVYESDKGRAEAPKAFDAAELVKAVGGVKAAVEATGASRATVYRWVKGGSAPKTQQYEALVQAAGRGGMVDSGNLSQKRLLYILTAINETESDSLARKSGA